jgi:hypothetical protein
VDGLGVGADELPYLGHAAGLIDARGTHDYDLFVIQRIGGRWIGEEKIGESREGEGRLCKSWNDARWGAARCGTCTFEHCCLVAMHVGIRGPFPLHLTTSNSEGIASIFM